MTIAVHSTAYLRSMLLNLLKRKTKFYRTIIINWKFQVISTILRCGVCTEIELIIFNLWFDFTQNKYRQSECQQKKMIEPKATKKDKFPNFYVQKQHFSVCSTKIHFIKEKPYQKAVFIQKTKEETIPFSHKRITRFNLDTIHFQIFFFPSFSIPPSLSIYRFPRTLTGPLVLPSAKSIHSV